MRLFVAVELDETVRAAAAGLVEELRRRAARLAPRARVTWVARDRMHLTLRFIGEVDEQRARAIEQALTPPLPLRPFALRVAGAGTFPAAGPPRVIWAGLSEGTSSLDALHRAVTQRLALAGIAPDTRPFAAHLTLGRVRDPAGLRARPLLDGLDQVDLGHLWVAHTVLMQSHLSPHGPSYTPRVTTRLES